MARPSELCLCLCAVVFITVGLVTWEARGPMKNPLRCQRTGQRAKAGDVLVESRRCEVNASSLDAGVCVDFDGVHCVPSLAVIGAMKSGTTNVMLYLSLHPSLRTCTNFFGWPIETRYFSSSMDPDWRGYIRRYPGTNYVFDKSPNYVFQPKIPAMLASIAPSIKILVMLRNPTRRAYSHFQHDCRNGKIIQSGSFIGRRSDLKKKNGGGGKPLAFPCTPRDFDKAVRRTIDEAKHRYDDDDDFLRHWSWNDGVGD